MKLRSLTFLIMLYAAASFAGKDFSRPKAQPKPTAVKLPVKNTASNEKKYTQYLKKQTTLESTHSNSSDTVNREVEALLGRILIAHRVNSN